MSLTADFGRTHLNRQFLRAAESGDFARLKDLRAQGASVNAFGDKGRNALSFAALRGDADMAAWLIAEKISADHQDDDGNTALHFAAATSDACVEKIAAAVTVHDAKNARGETPALVAVVRGTAASVETLVRAGADPDQREDGGNDGIPLVVVAEALQKQETVAVLLRLGANPDLCGGRKRETLALAAARLKNWPLARELAENGADIHAVNGVGEALIDLARKNSRGDVIVAVIDRFRPELSNGTKKPVARRKPVSFD